MLITSPEALSVAHRELVAAHTDWFQAFRWARSTLRHKDLVPIAQRLDEVFERFMKALEPLASK